MLKLYQEKIVTLEEVRASLNLGADTEIINELKQYDKVMTDNYMKEVSEDKEVEVSKDGPTPKEESNENEDSQ